mmetsp:Transcript_5892/g.9168  ORF Transcript_5892/g.9168 Transcript_5892/m.9168 type:complete len:133 (+) Transcript_5892:475-873(+)
MQHKFVLQHITSVVVRGRILEKRLKNAVCMVLLGVKCVERVGAHVHLRLSRRDAFASRLVVPSLHSDQEERRLIGLGATSLFAFATVPWDPVPLDPGGPGPRTTPRQAFACWFCGRLVYRVWLNHPRYHGPP